MGGENRERAKTRPAVEGCEQTGKRAVAVHGKRRHVPSFFAEATDNGDHHAARIFSAAGGGLGRARPRAHEGVARHSERECVKEELYVV